MRAQDLDYALAEALIAQVPLAQRDQSRLLVVHAGAFDFDDRHVSDLPLLLSPSVWVMNDTKVLPARLRVRKKTGGEAEVLLVERLAGDRHSERWLAWGRNLQNCRDTDVLLCDQTPDLQIVFMGRREGREIEVSLHADSDVAVLRDQAARLALPPYIHRDANEADRERYQSVFARDLGSVAAPTASLHFSEALLEQLKHAGHRFVHVTLHIGPGTFAPVEVDDMQDHVMHEERYDVSRTVAQELDAARANGERIVAVGTTALRTLETVFDGERYHSGSGRTGIFIRPPHKVRAANALLTNFHAPRTTLMALVMAMAGIETIRAAYAHAIEEKYRFLSYGDAMLIC